jgi:hypothetical protein
VLEVLKALADKQLEADIAREEDLEVVHRTVPVEVREARRTVLEEVREVVRHTGLDAVAEVAGSPAEGDHRIGQVEDLEEDHRSLLETADLVEHRSLVAGVLRSYQSEDLMSDIDPISESRILTGRLAISLLRGCAPHISRR